MILRALAFLLPFGLAATGCGGSEVQGGAAEAATLRCPPCGMSMAEGSELRELGGLRFALCNELCAEKVAEEPARYARYAAP